MAPLQLVNVEVQYTTKAADDLPQIDWPRRPQVFKREIADYVHDLTLELSCPDCGKKHALLKLLETKLGESRSGSTSAFYKPQSVQPKPGTTATPAVPIGPGTSKSPSKEFKGAHLPEITPFSNPAIPNPKKTTGTIFKQVTAKTTLTKQPATDDAAARLNELFGEDGVGANSGFIPDNNDITDILNRLLPDEALGGDAPAPARPGSAGAQRSSSGFAVFLAKIADEPRRVKAIPLLVELAKITNEEAEALSKKVIIPVLKGATKEQAEAAKQKFAKIGILARIKGMETAS
jgi:hypothetical protein